MMALWVHLSSTSSPSRASYLLHNDTSLSSEPATGALTHAGRLWDTGRTLKILSSLLSSSSWSPSSSAQRHEFASCGVWVAQVGSHRYHNFVTVIFAEILKKKCLSGFVLWNSFWALDVISVCDLHFRMKGQKKEKKSCILYCLADKYVSLEWE